MKTETLDRINDHLWFDAYKPIENRGTGTYYAIDGVNYTWETYSPEVDVVSRIDEKYIWTLIETDDGEFIIAGRHHVNRLAYFICEVAWDQYEEYTTFWYADHIGECVRQGDFDHYNLFCEDDVARFESAILTLEADDADWDKEIGRIKNAINQTKILALYKGESNA